MTAFRVGDRVQSVAPQVWPGALGTVVELADRDLYLVAVDVDGGPDPRLWWMDVDELEPAPESDACKACGEHISAPHSPQCPEDALNRIAEEWESQRQDDTTALRRIAAILRETGRLPELQ